MNNFMLYKDLSGRIMENGDMWSGSPGVRELRSWQMHLFQHLQQLAKLDCQKESKFTFYIL
jgi:hypothetical protein